MEVSSEIKNKVREFVTSEFGKDRILGVDLQMGFDCAGDKSFILSLDVGPDETFEDKGPEVFNLLRNIIEIGGAKFRGLTPVIDVRTVRD